MIGRAAFAYVVAIEGGQVTLNLKDEHRGHMAAHRQGLVSVTDTGSLFGVDSAGTLLVMRVRSLSFAEPREAHKAGVGTSAVLGDPLRHVVANVVGLIAKSNDSLVFVPDALTAPTLGAEAYPLSRDELAAVLNQSSAQLQPVVLGEATRGGGELTVGLRELLSRHVAVLGSTGQGKSCFTAAVLQQLLTFEHPRVVVFDINGEYEAALGSHVAPDKLKLTTIGKRAGGRQIPYYALGRHGLGRLLMPSEKTQRPALNFALDHLRHVHCVPGRAGVAVVGEDAPCLFDDCRTGDASTANSAIIKLRRGGLADATVWPPMRALAALVAESHAIKQTNNGMARAAFEYGNVSPLITLIWRFNEDQMFRDVVDVKGGPPIQPERLEWAEEGRALVDDIFGCDSSQWTLHIVNLANVAHDLMPVVLGSLLELLAFELFRRGQGATYPTLLVLEEAHHYLRPTGEKDDASSRGLAYERLAKEGRKFGLSLWLSTQRPSEMSATVLAQCGTWSVFRLTSQADLAAVAAATEWAEKRETDQIAGLRRRQAVVFGASVALPTRIVAALASPVPHSEDPGFDSWGKRQRR